MKTIAAALVGFALGVAAVIIGQRIFSRQFMSGLPPAMGDAKVSISLDESGTPKADPDPVSLANGRQVTWEIDPQMSAGEVVIDFAFQGPYKGPFRNGAGTNPHQDQLVGRGKYRRKQGDSRSIRSNAAEETGLWKYSVTYTPNGGQPKTKDPAVCIRN
jgi:hypothetical protein